MRTHEEQLYSLFLGTMSYYEDDDDYEDDYDDGDLHIAAIYGDVVTISLSKFGCYST